MATIQKVRVYDHDEQSYAPSRQHISSTNVGVVERLISGGIGGALVTYGLKRSDWPGAGLAVLGGGLLFRALTGRSLLYRALDVDTAGERVTGTQDPVPGKKGGVRIHRTVTIDRTPEELYAFWRDVENTPLYTPLVKSVTATGERTSRWVATLPGGKKTIEWNGELLEDIPSQTIAWHVHGTALTGNAGRVTFTKATGDRGTLVTLQQDYYDTGSLPLPNQPGRIARKMAEFQILETLRRFKELMETGEVASVNGQPDGR